MVASFNREQKKKFAGAQGLTLVEVLAASIIIFVVLAAAIGAYFITVLQGTREIIDSEVKVISRSIQDSIRLGARFNLAADKRSFFADVEGVRVFVPLPQPGQPAVDLPDYNEDVAAPFGGQVPGAGDIDWDQNGLLHAPAFAKPEPLNGDHAVDTDGDGKSWDDGDRPGGKYGTGEPFFTTPPGSKSQAYDGDDNDTDGAYDDVALFLYPFGLLTTVQDGTFRENTTAPPPLTWLFQKGLATSQVILAPMDEDLNHDGFVKTAKGTNPPPEGGLNMNLDPQSSLAYLPDTYEDLDKNGRITAMPLNSSNILKDINGDSNNDYNEFSEDFNLNGFLDVPTTGSYLGRAYYHEAYGTFPADPLSQGLVPLGANGMQPYSGANFVYATQFQQNRNFGYSLKVQRVEERGGVSQGFGSSGKAIYRFTLSLYFDYVRTIREFQHGFVPEPTRVQVFEVDVE